VKEGRRLSGSPRGCDAGEQKDASWAAIGPQPHACVAGSTRSLPARGTACWLTCRGTYLSAFQWPVGRAELPTDASVYHEGTAAVRRRDGRATRRSCRLAAAACRRESAVTLASAPLSFGLVPFKILKLQTLEYNSKIPKYKSCR
jgi:hypothetical protein